LLDHFLVCHDELKRSFPREYGRSEEILVETAMANAKAGKQKEPRPIELDLSILSETEKRAACWREMLTTYCRIHGRLKAEWAPWAEKDYQEFLTTMRKLRDLLQEKA
jgi:hypothetical protein